MHMRHLSGQPVNEILKKSNILYLVHGSVVSVSLSVQRLAIMVHSQKVAALKGCVVIMFSVQ